MNINQWIRTMSRQKGGPSDWNRHYAANLISPIFLDRGRLTVADTGDGLREDFNTADLKGRIDPCQFSGTPDCSQCGCIASAGLKAVGDYRLFKLLPLRSIFNTSSQIGRINSRLFGGAD